MTRCPKCDFELPPGAVECPACGIVPSKYRERAEPPAASTGAPPPAPGDHNPYAPPDAPLVDAGGDLYRAAEPAGSAGGITSATFDALQKTRPWLRFLVGYGFVLVALMVLGSLAVLIGSVASDAAGEAAPLAVGYLFYALVVLAIVMPLRRSTQALRDLDGSDLSGALESYTVHQATFWRRTGLLIAVGVALMVLAVVVMMILAAASLGG